MKKLIIQMFIIVCALAFLFAAGCAKTEDTAATSEESMGVSGEGVPDAAPEPVEAPVEAPAEMEAMDTDDAWLDAPMAEESEKATEDILEVNSDEPQRQVVEPKPGQLTAGEWSDNSNFDFFLNLLNNNEWYDMMGTWGYSDFSRIAVNVVSNDNDPIQNAEVELIDDDQNVVFAAKTDNNGIAYIFPYLFDNDIQGDFTLFVTYDGEQTSQSITEINKNQTIDVELDTRAKRSDDVDIMFMIDTTGSMFDELSYIQTELVNVIETVDEDNHNELDIRVSVNFYRDSGDEYILRQFDFSKSITSVVKQIKKQSADGGGDYPEAVDVALENAISEHDWNDDARARILFLVLDAPPHLNKDVLETLREQTLLAARKGIKIIPVASSGVDKNTEFLLRFLDVSTNGTYVFLTNHSGIGDSHIEPTIGMYDVEYLNNLLVRLINREVQ